MSKFKNYMGNYNSIDNDRTQVLREQLIENASSLVDKNDIF